MARSEVYSDYLYNVAAGESIVIVVGGEYVGCIASNQDDFLLSLDGDALQFMAQGLKIRTKGGDRFSNVTVDNSGNASVLTVRLAIGSGDLVDQRLSLTGAISVTRGLTLATVADVNCANAAKTSVLASNIARRRATVQNLDGAASVRVGDTNVTVARGIQLGPGDSYAFEVMAELFVRNDSGAAVLVAVMEEAD